MHILDRQGAQQDFVLTSQAVISGMGLNSQVVIQTHLFALHHQMTFKKEISEETNEVKACFKP